MALQSSSKPVASVKNQIIATLIATLMCISHGLAIGWTSPSVPLLLSDASPFSMGPVSIEAAAWIASIVSLGAIIGSLVYGTLSIFLGSQRALLLTAFPIIIHWIMLYFATAESPVIVARFLVGLTGGGVFICFPLFVSEISSEHIRGRLSSMLNFNFYTGIVLGYATVGSMEYYTSPLVMLSLPIIFIALFVWIPHTPQYLLKQNKMENAEKSLRFYRNIGKGAHPEDESKLKAELDKFMLIAEQNTVQSSLRISDFLSRDAMRGMLIGPTLMAVTQFSGTFVVSNYALTIFRETGTNIDPSVASIIMGCIQVLGCICASVYIDRVGRKFLLLVSGAGATAALAVTGTFAYLSANGYDVSAWNVVPVVSLSFFIFISAVGISNVPFVLVSEVLPPKIRRIGMTICGCFMGAFAFIMLLFFPVLLATVQLHGCMLLFGCVSAGGFVFTLFVVTETNGINMDQFTAKDKASVSNLP